MPHNHFEACKSLEASVVYASKEESRLDGPWEFGTKPAITQADKSKRGGEETKEKWEEVKRLAISGDIDKVDAQIYV